MNENSILLNSKIETNDLNSTINNYMGSEEDVIKSLTENKYVNEVLFSYKTKNYKKYSHLEMLAIDKLCGGGRKLYLGFLTKADKVKFIKNYKFKNLYEIITNEIVKPYFDIDYKTEKEHKTDEEVKIILERFILKKSQLIFNVIWCIRYKCLWDTQIIFITASTQIRKERIF